MSPKWQPQMSKQYVMAQRKVHGVFITFVILATLAARCDAACQRTTECPAYFICQANECVVNPDNKFHATFQCDSSDSLCPSGWHCVAQEKACFFGNARYHYSGQDCSNNKTCPNFYYCDQGACYLKAVGYPCTSDDHCNGYCLQNMCRIQTPNGICASDNHCPLDYFCKNGTCEYSQLSGACTSAKQCRRFIRACIQGQCIGIPSTTVCSKNSDCFAGNHCNRGSCASLIPVGSACNASYQCAGGAACMRNACAFKGLVGSTCDVDSNCADAFYCLNNTCTNRRTSGSCQRSQECLSTANYVCSVTSTCELTFPGKDCTSANQCYNFYSCDGSTRKCAYSGQQHQVGVTCEGTYDCDSGFACNVDDKTCYKDENVGDFVQGVRCTTNTDCREGFQCTGNTCFAVNG